MAVKARASASNDDPAVEPAFEPSFEALLRFSG
ncbi:hypothetical protein S40285_09738 [Stachybotrys chlorohalonatus IBT 40285]|uniref:Uncharacterized protein n=1 Tax=Stachybotrys chlorohalonatus (strain IBT 40285) TaxID=1283841 RepID=A0A084QL08_STAC4|nr:hypothetical protein S40285_09738 [Stachybotrys chlorohalonata IBT 40285]